jgi:hypothetical protein
MSKDHQDKVGKGKHEARLWMKKEMPEAFFEGDGLNSNITIVDMMILLKGFNPYYADSKSVLNAEHFVDAMRNQLLVYASKSDIMSVIVDKPFVPVQKGVTQKGRELSDIIPAKIIVPPGAENDTYWVELKATREKKKLEIKEREAMRKLVITRGFFIRKGETLPMPWQESTGGQKRTQLLQFLVTMFAKDEQFRMLPDPRKKIVFDGHYLSRFDKIGLESGKDDFCVPISFEHPSHERVSAAPRAEKVFRKEGMQVVFDMDEEDEDAPVATGPLLPIIKPVPELKNKLGEFDAAFLRHIVIFMSDPKISAPIFNVISTDSDIMFILLWFMYKVKSLIKEEHFGHVFGLDDDQVNIFKQNVKSFRVYNTFSERLGKTQYCDVNKLYDLLVSKFLHNNTGLVPSLLAAIASRSSDYTLGYYFISMDNIIRAYLQHIDDIGPIVQFSGDTLDHVILDGKAYMRMILWAYYGKYAQVKKRLFKGVTSMRGYVDKFDETANAMNELIVKGGNQYYMDVNNPDVIKDMAKMSDKDFDLLMRAIKKRIPPKWEVRNRALLVYGYLWMIHMYGNEFVKFTNPSDYGFAKINEGEDWGVNNIRMKATHDWDGHYEKRKEYIISSKLKAIPYIASNGKRVAMDELYDAAILEAIEYMPDFAPSKTKSQTSTPATPKKKKRRVSSDEDA